MSRLDKIQDDRFAKIEALQARGLAAYPSYNHTGQTVGEAREMQDQEVSVAGRLMALRGHGKLQFADLRDMSGDIQLMLRADSLSEDDWAVLELLDVGDFVAAQGVVGMSQRGEVSVMVSGLQLLTKSVRPLPDKWHGLTDVEERYRQRYVDLIVNDEVRQVMLTRTKVVTMLRSILDRKGFVEMETPVLQPLYGGAAAQPFVTHHNALDADFYMRISDELYLKRLVVGGIDKVYEMSKDFRNEGFSREHNPEFTMLEFYWAYADYDRLMQFTEEMWQEIIQEIHGGLEFTYQGQQLNFGGTWPRMRFADLLKEKLELDIDQVSDEVSLKQWIEERNLLSGETLVGYGSMLDELYKKHIRPEIVGPVYVTDYPAEMLPLAKRLADDPSKIGTFQLVIMGSEYLKAYNELNDPVDQRARWEEDMARSEQGADDYQVLDEDYIRALEYGMPPTAGWGMGIDRFVALLTNQATLKDVILFPTMRREE